MPALKIVPGSILALLLLLGCDLFQDPSSMKVEIQALVKQFAEAAQTDINGMLAMYEQVQELFQSEMAKFSEA